MKTVSKWLVCAALACTGAALAQDRAQVERRLQSVGTLIETSSAARQIDASADPQALEKRSEARALHRRAAEAAAAGDLVAASQLLDEAARAMVSGARLANPEQVTEEKRRRDFEARAESVKALLAAQSRIVREKGGGREAQEATRSIEAQLAQAQRLAQAGRLDEARPLLDRAYLTAKVSIESLRRGDTLVRTLHFASKREEYDYELDRNDTHRMLVRVLLPDRPGADAQGPVKAAVEAAARLRAEAEQLAARGDYEGAIAKLEESTRALVRGIRAAGVYIPG
jgi:tetratricopeptide (TPR) repeat protein